MARPKAGVKLNQFSIRLSPENMGRADDLKVLWGVSASEVMRECLERTHAALTKKERALVAEMRRART